MLRRPVPLAFLIGLFAEALFLFRVQVPHMLVFDEVHYIPAARMLMTLAGPRNTEHPLLGKELIALGIWLFGDDSFGWRVMSTLAASTVVMAMFAIAWLLWGRLRTAALTAAVVLLNFTVFVQARIAMLDGFMAAFVMGGIAALLWSMRSASAKTAWRRWLLGAAMLGLATACKWTALPYVGFAGLAFLWVRLRSHATVAAAARGRNQRHWPGLAAAPALLSLGGVAALAYLITFAPAFFYADKPLTLSTLLPFQADMFRQQTQVLPPHPYQSAWWSWPLMVRPIWYLYERADGTQRGILMLGNPAMLWSGVIAVALCLWTGWRERDAKLTAVAWLWIASLAIWAVIPKSLGFFYYYYLSSILLALPIAGAWQRFGRGRLKGWDEAYVIVLAGVFAWFFPILAALPLGGPQSFQRWMWLSSWP